MSSILVNARDLAVMAATLANGGVNSITKERAIDERVQDAIGVMLTCRMYDSSWQWVYQVGMPAHSTTQLAYVEKKQAILVAKSISKPVVELTKIVKEFSQGRLNQKAPVLTRDEIGQLAQSFNYDSPDETIASISQIGTQIYVDRGCRDEFQRLMKEYGKVTNFEYQVYRKDGSIIWVEEDTRAVRDSSGKLLYYEGPIQDISERKRQEEELKRQLQELRIEIDQQKRLSEVSVITQSDYFQEIQTEVEKIQLDEFWS